MPSVLQQSTMLLAGAGAALCFSSAAFADAFGNSFSNSAAISLTPSGGSLTYSADPNFRRAHATAFADHSDTPGSTFSENASTSFVSVGASEPNIARVTNAFANLAGLNVGCDEAYSFAHRIPPSNARADGLGEIEILFRITGATGFNLQISATGSASLMGDSLPDENWSANYQFYLEIYDAGVSGTPVLFTRSASNMLSGPGPASLTDAINLSGALPGLLPDHDYGLYAYFDSESTAIAPAPGTLLIGLSGALMLGRRRR